MILRRVLGEITSEEGGAPTARGRATCTTGRRGSSASGYGLSLFLRKPPPPKNPERSPWASHHKLFLHQRVPAGKVWAAIPLPQRLL